MMYSEKLIFLNEKVKNIKNLKRVRFEIQDYLLEENMTKKYDYII